MLSEIGFALSVVAVIVIAQTVAARTTLPAPVLLVLVGSGYTVLPLPAMRIDPTVFFDLLIPPLLYATSIRTSLFGLRRNLGAVLSLSVLLVLVTTFAVAGALSMAAAATGVPMGFAAAAALGAAVAPTDPVAAVAVARRVGMPSWLLTLLAGEGLLNDATSLTLFLVATSAVAGNASMLSATGIFFADVAGGVAFGAVAAWLVQQVRRVVHDSATHAIVSLATPFLAYLPAEALHTSGVLAVVVCGLLMGHRSAVVLPGQSRLELGALWQVVDELLQGFVFFLIGDQLATTTRAAATYPSAAIGLCVGGTVGTVLAARALWIWAGNQRWVRRVHLGLAEERRRLERSEMTVLWWSGSRGVITLAAAFSIPRVIDGHRLPDRPLLVLCAYLLVLFTLLVQGTSLSPISRLVRLPANGADRHRRLAEARVAAVDAGLQRLDELLQDDPQPEDVVAPLRQSASQRRQRSEDRLAMLGAEQDGQANGDRPESRTEIRRRLRMAMIDAQREELLQWRDSGRLPDRDLRTLQRELDHEEGLL